MPFNAPAPAAFDVARTVNAIDAALADIVPRRTGKTSTFPEIVSCDRLDSIYNQIERDQLPSETHALLAAARADLQTQRAAAQKYAAAEGRSATGFITAPKPSAMATAEAARHVNFLIDMRNSLTKSN